VGVFLSGGLDSSAVAAAMAAESGDAVKTFTVGFEDQDFDERPFGRLVAESLGAEHHELMVRPDVADVLPLLVRHYGEPFADSSALPTYCLSRAVRQSVKVALSGDGGDESFAGYNHYRLAERWGMFDFMPAAARKAVFSPLGKLLRALPGNNFATKAGRALGLLAANVPERYLWQIAVLKPEDKRACYTPTFRSLIAEGGRCEDRPADQEWDGRAEPPDWMMRHDQSFYLPDCLMVKTDVASMACGLEVRGPMLDHEFVEFAATIPADMKRRAGRGKFILRSALRDLLPAEILERPKAGFAVPLGRWLRGELADALAANLLDDRCRKRGLFRQDFLRRMADEHAGGRRDWSRRLWALMVLEMWFREFVD